MKGVASAVIGLAVAAAAGLGTYNLVTTGCPLGSCDKQAETSATALPVALDEGATKDGCCPLTGAKSDQGTMLVGMDAGGMDAGACTGEKMAECAGAGEGCSAEKMAACMGSAEGCTAEKMAACHAEQAATSGEAVIVTAAMHAEGEACAEMDGCCKEDGCLPGGECCKDGASED